MLKDYVKAVFQIADANKVDLGVGLDMLKFNLNGNDIEYQGADVDYDVLKANWNSLNEDEQVELVHNIDEVMSPRTETYKNLTSAFTKKDWEAFDSVFEENVN